MNKQNNLDLRAHLIHEKKICCHYWKIIFNSSYNQLKNTAILINAFIPSIKVFLFLISSTCFSHFSTYSFSPLLTCPRYLHILNIPLLKSLLFLLPSSFLSNQFQPISLGSIFSCLSQVRDYSAWGGFQTPTGSAGQVAPQGGWSLQGTLAMLLSAHQADFWVRSTTCTDWFPLAHWQGRSPSFWPKQEEDHCEGWSCGLPADTAGLQALTASLILPVPLLP